MIRVILYNTKDYGRNPETEEGRRHDALVRETLRELRPDARTVFLLTELPGHSLERAQRATHDLAGSMGLSCIVRPNAGAKRPTVYAVAPSMDPATHNQLCVGMMWGSDLRPVADSFHAVPLSDYHTLGAMLTLECDGIPLTLMVRHQPSLSGRGGNRAFVRQQRIVGSRRAVHALSAPGNSPFVVLGEDANSISAARVDGVFYDPDPYNPTGPACEVSEPADRTPSQVLIDGGYTDIGAHCLPYDWKPTTGHWPGEQNGDRRIDIVSGSEPLITAMDLGEAMVRHNEIPQPEWPAYWVYDSPTARETSDHRPVGISLHEVALQAIMR